MIKGLISVIIPVCNEENNIANCIQSVINQSYTNIEIIIVYRESSDNTLSIVQSFNDARLRFITQDENSGAGGARNIGIDVAKGEYIGFVESEVINPDYYKKLYNSISQANSDIAIGTINIIKPGINNKITNYTKAETVYTLIDKLSAMQTGACFDKLFRSSLIKDNNIKFPESLAWEDNAFLVKAMYYAKSISFVPDCNYVWHAHDWDGEYANYLKNSIIPIAQIIMDFAKEKKFNRKEMEALKLKMFKNFAKSYILKDNVYKDFKKIIGFSLPVSYRYWQMRKRELRRKIFNKEK